MLECMLLQGVAATFQLWPSFCFAGELVAPLVACSALQSLLASCVGHCAAALVSMLTSGSDRSWLTGCHRRRVIQLRLSSRRCAECACLAQGTEPETDSRCT